MQTNKYKTLTTILILLIFQCAINKPIEFNGTITHADSVNLIDTAFFDTMKQQIKPPCSMSPDYCDCMKHRGIIGNGCQ